MTNIDELIVTVNIMFKIKLLFVLKSQAGKQYGHVSFTNMIC